MNYDLYNWKLLSQQLREEHDKIHFINRAQLIDDSVALAVDEYLPFSVPFELMTYLDKEQDMIPWFSALNKFDHLYPLYELTEAGPLLKVRSYLHVRAYINLGKILFVLPKSILIRSTNKLTRDDNVFYDVLTEIYTRSNKKCIYEARFRGRIE